MQLKYKTKWIIVIIIVVFGFFSYTYNDPIITQRHGIELWNALFSGNFFHYYQYCADNTSTLAVYDFSTYLLFGIWNLPCWIYEKASGLNAQDSAFWIFYGKGLMLATYFVCVWAFRDLSANLISLFKENESDIVDESVLFFACSVIVLMYDVYTGNYDLTETVFIILGISFLVKDKNKLFLLFFSIAVSMKYFAVWIFIPIILLKEKKIVKIIWDLVICFGITLIENIVWDKSRVIVDSGTLYFRLPSKAFSAVAQSSLFNLDIGNFSICFVLYALLCIYCYMQSCDDKTLLFRKIVYCSLIAWLIFFSTCQYNCYWVILLTPFLSLLVFQNRKNMYINLILETLLSYAILCCNMIDNSWVIGGADIGSHAVLDIIISRLFSLGIPATRTLGDLAVLGDNAFGIGVYARSTIIVCFIALAIINYPGQAVQKYIPELRCSELDGRRLVSARNIIGILAFLLPTVYYCYQIVVYNIIN